MRKKDIELIVEAIEKIPCIEEVLLFGSRAKGSFKKGSDIDLALKGVEVDDQVASRIKGILEDEIHLPYQFDVVNYHSISNPDFKDHIDRVGLIFFQKKKSKTSA
ncbi:MAG: nucleotidyltransferase domain-containing protein [Bacteroidetes bacterium]|nr:nucleotidyltransferase domain-containing protein [Bacteroidota bacterium]